MSYIELFIKTQLLLLLSNVIPKAILDYLTGASTDKNAAFKAVYDWLGKLFFGELPNPTPTIIGAEPEVAIMQFNLIGAGVDEKAIGAFPIIFIELALMILKKVLFGKNGQP